MDSFEREIYDQQDRGRDDRSMFAPAPRGRREMHANSGALQVFASPSRGSFSVGNPHAVRAANAAAAQAQAQLNQHHNQHHGQHHPQHQHHHHLQQSPPQGQLPLSASSFTAQTQQVQNAGALPQQQQQQQRGQVSRDTSTPATDVAANISNRNSAARHRGDGGGSSSGSSSSSSSTTSTVTSSDDDDDDDDDASTASSSSTSSDDTKDNTQNTQRSTGKSSSNKPASPSKNHVSSGGPFRVGDLVGANRFEILSILGRGAFSYVYLVRRRAAAIAAPPPQNISPTPTPPGSAQPQSRPQQRPSSAVHSAHHHNNISNHNYNGAATANGGGNDGEPHAMKVFRPGRRYDSAAMHEWDTLQSLKLALCGGNGASSCSASSTSYSVPSPSSSSSKDAGFLAPELGFRSRNQFSCIVLPLGGPSLLQVLKTWQAQNRSGLPEYVVRSIAFQLLTFVAGMHRVGIVNTDLKVDNVVFLTNHMVHGLPVHSQVACIDFSNAVFRIKDLTPSQQAALPEGFPRHHEHGPSLIQTRHYRAPEVIVGARWSFPADVWSLGCVLCEMVTGRCLFMTHEDDEHVAMMFQVLGHGPAVDTVAQVFGEAPNFKRLIAPVSPPSTAAAVTNNGGNNGGEQQQLRSSPPSAAAAGAVGSGSGSYSSPFRPCWPTEKTRPQDIGYVRRLPTLAGVSAMLTGGGSDSGVVQQQLLDLLRQMLEWDPRRRITAEQALRHPFFQ